MASKSYFVVNIMEYLCDASHGSLRPTSWKKFQYVQNLHMLPPTARPTISWRIKGGLESGELDADSVVAFFATVRGFETFYSTHNLR